MTIRVTGGLRTSGQTKGRTAVARVRDNVEARAGARLARRARGKPPIGEREAMASDAARPSRFVVFVR